MSNYLNRIAVLITCHNRREKTLRCLRSLFIQHLPVEMMLGVFLVDDGSTDGTSESVAKEFPQVKIIRGNGQLYWCGGMRLAWTEALKDEFDAYLWLNDDVQLEPDTLLMLIKTESDIYEQTNENSIIVGACADPISRRLNYGGYPINNRKGNLPESSYPQQCYSMNGNIVLVPCQIVLSVGNISKDYTHNMGDVDYGIRAGKKGFKIYVAPGISGVCETNQGNMWEWVSSKIPFRTRWKLLHSPKGVPPIEYMEFRRRCGVRLWFLIPVKLYLQVLFPWIWEMFQ